MRKNQKIEEISNRLNINYIYAHSVADRVAGNNYIEDAKKLIIDKPKPFVKWVGGKRQLLKQFRDLKLYPPE